MNIYNAKDFYVIRKPNGISTTIWDQHNFLEIMINHKEKSQIISDLYEQYKDIYLDKINEFGLINRLDNGTGGCLWFAKSTDIYQDYKQSQKTNSVNKTYIANIYGKIEDVVIDSPIWHHYSDTGRMTTEQNLAKKMQACQTEVKLIKYHEEADISTIQVTISQGIRHQIRVHLASISKFIVWENIYTTKWFRKKLSENALRQNLDKYIYTEQKRFEDFESSSEILEKNDIYMDNFLYNRDFLTYHLRSINIKKQQ